MAQESNGVAPPTTARQLKSPAALALADLAALFDDMQSVLRCCERLLAELTRGAHQQDDLIVESLWVDALTCYARCFRSGARGMGLSVTDLEKTGLKGDVVEWHALLGRLRNFYVDSDANPREAYSVGVSQNADGRAEGITITSIIQPQVDETTVRQTGRLAFELSRMLDERIQQQQKTVFAAAEKMSAEELGGLTEIDISAGPNPIAAEQPAGGNPETN